MMTTKMKSLKWVGLMCGTGLIAISASTLTDTPALAGTLAWSTNQQVAEADSKPQNQLTPSQKQQQKNIQKGGPLQYRQGGQQQGGQQQGGQQQGGQQQGGQQQGGQQQGGQQQGGQQQYQQGGQQQGWQQQYQQGGQKPYQQGGPPPNQPGGQQQYQQGGQQQYQYQQAQRYDWSHYQPGRTPPQWDQYHRNFDPRPYQWNQYADHSYRGQPYSRPRGWYDRRWAYGQILPSPFWARNYWLDSYWGYGLVDPPYGYVWVRYGNDALLVSIITGQILGAVYWLFY